MYEIPVIKFEMSESSYKDGWETVSCEKIRSKSNPDEFITHKTWGKISSYYGSIPFYAEYFRTKGSLKIVKLEDRISFYIRKETTYEDTLECYNNLLNLYNCNDLSTLISYKGWMVVQELLDKASNLWNRMAVDFILSHGMTIDFEKLSCYSSEYKKNI